MGSSTLMNLGVRAMAANFTALHTTSNNISNANVEGYSRQSVVLETANGQQTGQGFFGRGVDVRTVVRSYDEFLTREAAVSRSAAAGDAARAEQLSDLERVFGLGESGIGQSAVQFFNAMADVINQPSDASARQVVLARANEMATRMSAAGEQLDTIQQSVNTDLRNVVSNINSLTDQIAKLNVAIAATKGSNHTPNDLLDQRDLAINKLSEFLQVHVVQSDDDTVGVFMSSGQQLVLGSESQSFSVLPDPFDTSIMRLGVQDTVGLRMLSSVNITGGRLSGLLAFQETDLNDARQILGQMATAVAYEVNEQQALGLDLRQPPGAGAPIFDVGLPVIQASSNNARTGLFATASYINASGARVPTVGVTVTNSRALMASGYELYADPSLAAGSYQFKRLSDGQTWTVSNGSQVDGMRIDIVAPPPAPRDRFVIQPVARAAVNMQMVLQDPKGLAASSPVVGAVAVNNTGTATVANLRAASTSLNANLTATLTFGVGGAYTWSLVDTTGTLATTTGAGTWSPGQLIQLNGWELSLDGVPASGDQVTVQKTAYPAGNNGNMKALMALRDAAIVGEQDLGAAGIVPGNNVTDAFAHLIAEVGVRSQTAKAIAAQTKSIADSAKLAMADRSGVNLDEEAAKLIQFQQSYQAAAKMLQVAQTLFDQLLALTGR